MATYYENEMPSDRFRAILDGRKAFCMVFESCRVGDVLELWEIPDVDLPRTGARVTLIITWLEPSHLAFQGAHGETESILLAGVKMVGYLIPGMDGKKSAEA